MPVKVHELLARLEADGWFQVAREAVTGSFIIRPSRGL